MSMETIEPTFADILAARRHVYRYVQRTPLHLSLGLSDLPGTRIYVKHENHHAVGAFKVRGGGNLAAHLSDAEGRGRNPAACAEG